MCIRVISVHVYTLLPHALLLSKEPVVVAPMCSQVLCLIPRLATSDISQSICTPDIKQPGLEVYLFPCFVFQVVLGFVPAPIDAAERWRPVLNRLQVATRN